MSLFEELEDLGVDVNEGLERVVGDEPLYEMLLGMFIDTVRDNPIDRADFDENCLEELIGRVHTLKGLAGNLEMTPLFTGYMQILDYLRTHRVKEALEEYEHILPIQEAIMDCIRRHMSI